MALSKVEFENLLELLPQLSPEQTQVVRQHLEDYWFKQFSNTLASIRAKLPADIPEAEIEADIVEAIREVRTQK